jgi:hypothetical protein
MNRDPTVVGRAKVGAETFAGVVNSFVDPISWKTMVSTRSAALVCRVDVANLNTRAKRTNGADWALP